MAVAAARSQALVQHVHVGAVQAADVAAPVEGAVAALGHALRAGPVAPAAAQQLAALQSRRGAVAGAAGRARRARLTAGRAEVGRLLEVDQVVGGGRLVRGVLGLQVWQRRRQLHARRPVAALVAVDDARGAVEAVFEEVTHRAEGGQPHPARLDRARTRHAVALALLAHFREDRLQKREAAAAAYQRAPRHGPKRPPHLTDPEVTPLSHRRALAASTHC